MENLNRFLENYKKDTDENNRIIQFVLREIDFDILIPLLKRFESDIRQIFFRNLSERVSQLVKEEINFFNKQLPAENGKKDGHDHYCFFKYT